MTEPTSQVSLEDVQARFLEAETSLRDAGKAIQSIHDAAERLGVAREGLGAASQRLAELATTLGDVTDSLAANAEQLRQGVDAIKAGDPAAIKRQIEELDSAFTAMQSVVGERLTQLDAKVATLSSELVASATSQAARSSRALREARILGAIVVVLLIVGIATSLVLR